ncbi:MAG: alpha-galactosidase [Chloroflexota bacterium]
MTITWQPETREWHLANGRVSWVLCVLENGWIGQLHAGPPLSEGVTYRHLGPLAFHGFDNRVGEPVALVLPVPGVGDFRVPSLVVEHGDGSSVLDLRYAGHRIVPGKPPLPHPLPASYVEDDSEADTLEIDVADEVSGIRATISTTLFADRPIVARSVRITNAGASPVTVRFAMSATLDLPDADWTLVQLSGTWARERAIVERPLVPGRQGIGSVRGGSGHEHNPFIALRRPATTETHGDAWGALLVYSGNFVADVEVEPHGTARLRLGINPEGFAWHLAPGETFATPEALIAWSDAGLDGLSAAFHPFVRERVARGAWRDRDRSVLLNSWEAVYFDFDHDRIVGLARAAKSMGIELFVLDDGWFGVRDDDRRSLGDWVVDRRKLPHGIDGLAGAVHEAGLGFGLWIEPEMVNEDSDLFRAHPDWAIGVPGRQRTRSRNQLVLDLARPVVVDHLEAVIGDLLSGAAIDYVKWDWNRSLTEPFSASLGPERQGEVFHRYVLGLYDLYDRVVRRFPGVLFESCAGGGGRFDAGLFAFAPQAWTSDDTDGAERLRIQYGTSLAYPLSTISAHVSAVPNHQTGRLSPLSFRAAVAMFGVFGYELDPVALSDEERATIGRQVEFYVERRGLLQRGRFARLRSPFEGDGNETAWMVVAPDGSHALAAHYRVLYHPIPVRDRLRLRLLDPDARYEVTTWVVFDRPSSRFVRGGDELMQVGIGIEPPDIALDAPPEERRDLGHRLHGDFRARLFELRRT